MKQKCNILIPMAGRGSRFEEQGYTDKKPFIDVNGKPMIHRVIKNLGIEFTTDYKFILICLQEDFDKYDFTEFEKVIGHNSYDVVILDDVTEGAAQTVLTAKDLINDDTPLMTMNSDQLVDWDVEKMFEIAGHYDALIPCFYGEGNAWSYARTLDNGYVQEVAEKKQISNNATAGYYYWKKGSDFVKYAEQMIKDNSRTNGEFYVAPVYNWAVRDGKKVGIYMVDKLYSLGTPEDLQEYLSEV
jgi:dTDP-glucose pyrophosphorylase|tara:strand:+ start:93 stop:821 length:729 start_codon:yes stop_codon:yes gene_type:complete